MDSQFAPKQTKRLSRYPASRYGRRDSSGPALAVKTLRQKLRALRLFARHDPYARKELKEWAVRKPASLAGWSYAQKLWLAGEVAAARQSAEVVLQTRPHDFDMLLICLDYHIGARDSVQVDAYAKRLLAAKNPAAAIRRTYAAVSIVLWPLWLMGYKGGRGLKVAAEKYDRWVEWAKYYVAKRPNNVS